MSKKRMTVEMTEPFVWPDPPEDMAPYVSPSLFSFFNVNRTGLTHYLKNKKTGGKKTTSSKQKNTKTTNASS